MNREVNSRWHEKRKRIFSKRNFSKENEYRLLLYRTIYVYSYRFTILDNKEFLCIARTAKHNYILPINTVIIQLHVSVLYVDHLQVEILTYRLVIQDVWGICVGGDGRTRSRCFNSGYHDPELLQIRENPLVTARRPPPAHPNAPHISYN